MNDYQETKLEILSGSFTTDKKTLLQIVKSVSGLIEDASFKMTNEGLFFRSMDVSHVALLDMILPNTIFEKYCIMAGQKETNADLKFAFRTDEFLRIVKSLDTKGSISVNIKPYKQIIELNQNGFSSTLKTTEPTEQDTPLPKIDYNTIVCFDKDETKQFVKILKKIETQSDYINLISNGRKLEIKGTGDNGFNSAILEPCFDRMSDSNSVYSLEYLKPFLQSLSKDSEIDLSFSSTKPIKITARINNTRCLWFYLAPRIEN